MSYQKLLANSQSLADLLDENMPDLPQEKPTPEGRLSSKASKQDAGLGLGLCGGKAKHTLLLMCSSH